MLPKPPKNPEPDPPPPERPSLAPGIRRLGWLLAALGVVFLVFDLLIVLGGNELSPVAFLISSFIVWMGYQTAQGRRWWDQFRGRK